MQEFKHSVKVPRNYKLAANILKKTLIEGASAKTLVFQDKLRHFRTNVLYALVSEAIKHNGEIDRLFEFTNILQNEPRLDPWLAKILTVELLFGKKGLPGKSKPELTVASYKEQFEKYSTENPDQITKKAGNLRPRYVRINTILLTTSDAIRAFQDEGYRFMRCTSGSYNDYLEQVTRLEQYDFLQDYHVKTVFVFAPGTKLYEHDLYLENKIILQDKATAMVAQMLAPPPGSVVMDMCAAPGMKTTHLAAFMKNQGKVYAVERSEERYKTLCNFVGKTGSTCVETINKDVLDINRNDYLDVEYVLLDPSCSGSGMELTAHTTHYTEDARLARLTSLQEKFLKHAMNAFPKVKRIVYSTCSLFPQENERVVTNVVNQCRDKWNVLNVKELLKDQWNNFGTGMYGSIGPRCMYARPEYDFTTGFFLAVMEKAPKRSVHSQEQDAENNIISNEAAQSNKKPSQKKSRDIVLVNQDENETQRNTEFDQYSIVENEETDNLKKKTKKEKKKNKKAIEETFSNDDKQSQNLDVIEQAENVQGEAGETEKITETGDKKAKKKKQKKAKQENVLVSVNDPIDVIAKRKKNKNKEKSIDEDDLEIKDNKTHLKEDGASKKKGKKRNRELDLGLVIDLEASDSDKEDAKPKKKKKGKGNRELVEG